MSSSAGPWKKLRVATLSIAWCFAVIAGCVGLNALIKSNQDKSRLKKLAPAPTVVYINTNDIFSAGVAATTASLLISILTSNYVAGMFLPFTRELSRRTLRLQSFALLFACMFLFASMIPFMLFFVNRQADVKAFIGSVQLPDSVLKAAEEASGSTIIYKKIRYLKLVAIFPWLSLFFTLIAAGVLFVAGGAPVVDAPTKETPAAEKSTVETTETTEKEDASHHEQATV